jgi:NAD(P)-dependent dehydrogenase (short-subunit alcohol dehydrogenase family)
MPDWTIVSSIPDNGQDINVKGCLLCQRAAVKYLGYGGAVVNLASVAGITGPPTNTAYAASKAAVLGLTRVMAAEYGAKGIRANSVLPGVIATTMVQELTERNGFTYDAMAAKSTFGRLGHPSEVAHMISFLLDPRSSFCTGGASWLVFNPNLRRSQFHC